MALDLHGVKPLVISDFHTKNSFLCFNFYQIQFYFDKSVSLKRSFRNFTSLTLYKSVVMRVGK